MTETDSFDGFEAAFHKTADRHERVWIFLCVTMLSLLMVGSLFYVVHDYGLVTKGDTANGEDATTQTGATYPSGSVVATGANAYSVYLTAHLWSWSTSPIHVKQGAEITFHLTSADVLHGFEVQGTPINLTAVPGVVGTVTYTFRHAGVYYIICNEYCGLEHQAMIGQIIVDPVEVKS